VIEFYSEIRFAHMVLAMATGVLFAARGLLVQAGHAVLANHVAVRYLSYTVDTALLTAALMLLTMLRLSPLNTSWLALKICVLVAYVALGSLALRRAPTAASRRACYVAALAHAAG
jgi:uncharacterized membrane protein SirB2